MTKLFQRFHLSRKQQQQARRSLGSSSIANDSTIRMESTRPASIYLQNQSSSGRTGVNEYTCSPRLSLYLKENKDHLERVAASRHSSLMLRQLQGSLMEDLYSSLATGDSQEPAIRGAPNDWNSRNQKDASTRSLSTIGLSERNKAQNEDEPALPRRFDIGDYLDDNEFSVSMFQNNKN